MSLTTESIIYTKQQCAAVLADLLEFLEHEQSSVDRIWLSDASKSKEKYFGSGKKAGLNSAICAIYKKQAEIS